MSFQYKKFNLPVLKLIKQSSDPSSLSLAIAIGITVGAFPVLGPTTFLCFIFAWLFKLNAAAVQVINYSSYPFQLLVMVPTYRLASNVSGITFPPDVFSTIFEQGNILGFLKEFGILVFYAIGVWVCFAIPFGAAIYFLAKRLLVRFLKTSQNSD